MLLTTRRRDDRGAVAPIVAILLSSGLILGLLALTVDVGNILWERRQLQNGADSTALALAATCASAPSECAPSKTTPDLDPLLDGNAADNLAQFDTGRTGTGGLGQCGYLAGSLPACGTSASYADLTACPPKPAWMTSAFPYVETYARTQSTAGTVLPSYFARGLAGAREASVSACSRVAWGRPKRLTAAVPLMLSVCEWQSFTGSGSSYELPPAGAGYGYGGSGQPVWPLRETSISLHKRTDGVSCTYAGKDRPGGFGWAAPDSGDCSVRLTNDGWVRVDTGKSADASCLTLLRQYKGKVIQLPIFDCVSRTSGGTADCNSGAGANTYYHVLDWASFYVSGFDVPSASVSDRTSVRTGSAIPCTSACLAGWFVKDVVDAEEIVPPGGGTDFGVVAIRQAG